MAHIHEAIDFTVEVFVVHNGKVLLRKHDKYNIWLSVGGHVELSEDPNQAAVREVKEEVGLDVKLYSSLPAVEGTPDGYQILIPPQFMNRHRINETHEHVTMVYFASSEDDTINQLVEEEKTDECRWFTEEELISLSDIKNVVRDYALTALQTLAA